MGHFGSSCAEIMGGVAHPFCLGHEFADELLQTNNHFLECGLETTRDRVFVHRNIQFAIGNLPCHCHHSCGLAAE